MTPDSDPIGLSPFTSPVSARNAVDRLVEETWSAHEKLGMIEGQVGGAPPMDDADLRAAGFAEMTNLNFRGSKQACVRAASTESSSRSRSFWPPFPRTCSFPWRSRRSSPSR